MPTFAFLLHLLCDAANLVEIDLSIRSPREVVMSAMDRLHMNAQAISKPSDDISEFNSQAGRVVQKNRFIARHNADMHNVIGICRTNQMETEYEPACSLHAKI